MARKTDKVLKYESTGDYIKALSAPYGENWEQYANEESGRESFYGCGYSQALEYASNGWSEGLRKVEKELALIPQGEGKAWVYDVAGATPCIGKFLSGVPDCMRNRRITQASKKPVIDLVISRQMHCGVDFDRFMRVGIAIVELIDSLEKSGYSVNLDSVSFVGYSGRDLFGNIITLKKSGEILDLEKLIFFMAHPSALRRLDFKFRRTYTRLNEYFSNGLGNSADWGCIKKHCESGAINMIVPDDIVNTCYDMVMARKVVRAQFENQMPNVLDSQAA